MTKLTRVPRTMAHDPQLFSVPSTGFIAQAAGQTYAGRGYIRAASNGIDFSVGFEQAGNKSSEYLLEFNTEDFLSFRTAYVGWSVGRKTVPTLTSGTFNNSGTTKKFTLNIGASFTFDFEGTGVYFNFLKEQRGGVWEFTVDGGTAFEVSCYSAESVTNATVLLADGLADGTHTVVATFLGADPSTVGTPRGYLDYDNFGTAGNSTATTIPEYPVLRADDEIALTYAKDIAQVIGSGTVLDFAIRARPASTAVDTTWVPYHTTGAGGASTRNIGLTIIVDGVVIDNDASLLDGAEVFQRSVIVRQTYDAYNNLDLTSTKMWSGTYTMRFEAGVLTTTHTIKIAEDTFVDDGYMAVFSANSNQMDKLQYSNGYTQEDTTTWSGVTEDHFQGETPFSAAFQSSSDGSLSAFETSLADALALDRGSNTGVDMSEVVFAQSRTSSLIKCYWKAFDDTVLSAGDTFRTVNKYFAAPDVSLVF
jgi:hypothetical protein